MPAIALAAGLTGCLGGTSPEPADGLKIAVAPLSLPTVSKVCYDIEVTNGPNKTGDTVWSKGTPGLNGGIADSDAICSTRYGNLGGGDISYVGPCDADGQEDPIDAAGERTNSVTIWFDGIYDGADAYVDPNGPNGWQNPCLDVNGDEVGCTLNVLCEENADAEVEFNFTILREANQGFFDIAVNFGDIFCSAKFDCSYAVDGVCSGAGGTCTTGTLVDGKTTCDTNADCVVQDPINLLHNGDGDRDRTFVLGFACTAGPGTDVETDLYLNDLEFDCNGDGNSAVFTADFTLNTAGVIDGNQCTAGAMEDCSLVTSHGETLDPDDYFFQYAVYRGAEQLEDSLTNAPLNKKYWNVAIGVKPAIAGCQIRTAGTAEDVANLADGANHRRVEPGQTYPAIVWDVRADSCAQEVLSVGPAGEYFANAAGEPAMVRVLYTAIDNEGVTFDNAYSGTIPLSQRCRTHSDCRTGFQCTNDGTCRDADGEIQGECLRDVFDEDATALSAPAAGGYKWAGWTRLPSDVGVRQTANSTASVFPTRLEATAGEIVFTARVVAGGDDDYIGWAVGATANATGLGSPGGEFLLFKWKRSTQSGAAGGLRLARVNGVADNNAIWTDTGAVSTVASATACANPPATALDCGWQRDRGYRVRMAYATSRIQVWITPEHRVGARYNVDAPVFRTEDEVQVFDVVGTFPTGALGFFSQSQPGSEFRVISVAGTAPDAAECGGGDPPPTGPTAGESISTPAVGTQKFAPPGTFVLGCLAGRDDTLVWGAVGAGCYDTEKPPKDITLTRGLWAMEAEVTEARWIDLMGTSPSTDGEMSSLPTLPVTLNWWESLALANAASTAEGLAPCYTLVGCTGTPGLQFSDPFSCEEATINSQGGTPYACAGYRLPTEAEWEYLARGGTATLYSGSNNIGDVAWHGEQGELVYNEETESEEWVVTIAGNSGDVIHPPCGKARNGFGLCDMTGNVEEWVWDSFEWQNGYPGTYVTDPVATAWVTAWGTPLGRIVRGGGYMTSPWLSRNSHRFNAYEMNGPGPGVRLVRSFQP